MYVSKTRNLLLHSILDMKDDYLISLYGKLKFIIVERTEGKIYCFVKSMLIVTFIIYML